MTTETALDIGASKWGGTVPTAYARAMLNLLTDFSDEKIRLGDTQRAILNVLEDASVEKSRIEETQTAVLNILTDFSDEKIRLGDTQRAILNVLEDASVEQARLEETQKAVLNVLEDFEMLNWKLEGRTLELSTANKELETFTYSVSHDLRAPLRHIAGFSGILLEEFGSTLEPQAQQYLQRIQEGTRKMGQLVDELLNLAQVGRHSLSLQVTGLNSIVQEVVSILKPESEGRQVEWNIADLPFVECDPVLIRQVFQNLLANALKFTRPRPRALIEVGQTDENGHPAIFVRDNGVGFSMKYADKLFGVFQRLHRPEDFEGTGIGLATVQRIIQKHGGRVWVQAELDRGATFYFTLWVQEQTQQKSNAATIGA